jgi:hypothetical protein
MTRISIMNCQFPMMEEDPPDEPRGDVDRARTQFVANSSRDLRTPLILLLGPLQDILDSPASALAPTSRSVLEAARRNALALLKLLDTLPGLSRGERARTGKAADLAAFTAELTRNFRTVCDEAGLLLIVDCPPLSETVAVDRDVWETIVLNLVAHAFKSTSEGSIEVRVRAQDGHVQLIVIDTGTDPQSGSQDLAGHFDAPARTRNGAPNASASGWRWCASWCTCRTDRSMCTMPGTAPPSPCVCRWQPTIPLPVRVEGRVESPVPAAQDGGAVGTQPSFIRRGWRAGGCALGRA